MTDCALVSTSAEWLVVTRTEGNSGNENMPLDVIDTPHESSGFEYKKTRCSEEVFSYQ
jgi:hypothetical protein